MCAVMMGVFAIYNIFALNILFVYKVTKIKLSADVLS